MVRNNINLQESCVKLNSLLSLAYYVTGQVGNK